MADDLGELPYFTVSISRSTGTTIALINDYPTAEVPVQLLIQQKVHIVLSLRVETRTLIIVSGSPEAYLGPRDSLEGQG